MIRVAPWREMVMGHVIGATTVLPTKAVALEMGDLYHPETCKSGAQAVRLWEEMGHPRH